MFIRDNYGKLLRAFSICFIFVLASCGGSGEDDSSSGSGTTDSPSNSGGGSYSGGSGSSDGSSGGSGGSSGTADEVVTSFLIDIPQYTDTIMRGAEAKVVPEDGGIIIEPSCSPEGPAGYLCSGSGSLVSGETYRVEVWHNTSDESGFDEYSNVTVTITFNQTFEGRQIEKELSRRTIGNRTFYTIGTFLVP